MTGPGENSDLTDLTGEVAKVDLLIAPAPVTDQNPPLDAQAAQAEVSAITEAAELASILQAITSLFVPVFPSLAGIYTPETCGALATATIPVMYKHGWTVPGILANWAEEIALATVAVPLGLATWHSVKADIAKAEKKPETAPVPASIPDLSETASPATKLQPG